MAHIRAWTLVSTLPLAAVLLAGRPVSAGADPWPPINEIVSGSSSPGSAAAGSAFDGIVMELGPSVPLAGWHPGTGSASSYSVPAVEVAPAMEVAPAVEIAPAVDEVGEAESAVVAAEREELPQPDSGSVRSACAAGVAVGSALIFLGSATGSGLGNGLVGVGSSGSGTGSAAVGSAAVGSAVTGSALLCLLWPLEGVPPTPGNPLELGPPDPAAPAPSGPAPVMPVVPGPVTAAPLELLADVPDSPVAPRVPGAPLAWTPPPSDPVAWNLLQLLTILVIAILSTVRGIAAVKRKHSG
ncbi:hypothetical protein [Nocardia sp. XZ_19_385]|uniref:hypothetical protein n=1 Tax=Nocardia sp. XZ_19_385 TaxID=2769488 RepID=UPI00188F31CE|nr:hypothetical protein [Nocardia sp. XZ_19_385]